MELSIVIPVYNEEKRIERSLVKILDYCKSKLEKYEVIIIDDGSKDKTNQVISLYKSDNVKVFKNSKNMGKGYSVKRGILEAKYPLVLFSDSDLSTPLSELKKFIEYINKGYDIVIASRKLKGSFIKTKQPLYRQLMGKTFPFLVNLLVLNNIKDTQCGFKLFKTKAAKKIFELLTFDGWAFDVEVLFIATKSGYKIKELPVVWVDKPGSKVNPIKDAYCMFKDLFKIRYNNFMGVYTKN